MSAEETMLQASKLPRHPKSAPGDFYVENGQCLSCGVPHVVAPTLIGWVDEEKSHCYWKKQPETPQELEQAIGVLDAQELDCHRYAGSDPRILDRSLLMFCDYPLQLQSATQEPTELHSPRFELLNDRPGPFAALWKRITTWKAP
jgi:hypothetical protein